MAAAGASTHTERTSDQYVYTTSDASVALSHTYAGKQFRVLVQPKGQSSAWMKIPI